MLNSIKNKIVLSVIVLTLLLQTSSSLFQFFQVRQILIDGMSNEAKNITIPFQTHLEEKLATDKMLRGGEISLESLEVFSSILGYQEFPPLLKAKAQINSIQLVNLEGKIIAHAEKEVVGTMIDESLIDLTKNPQFAALDQEEQIVFFVPFIFEEQMYGGFLVSYSNEQLVQERNLVLMTMAGLLFTFIVLGSIGAWFISKTIIQPVNLMSAALRDIVEGEGDLTKTINIRTKDEIGELAVLFNVFVGNIRKIVQNIKTDASQVASVAEELSKTVHQNKITINEVSKAIEKDSAVIVQSAATIQEMARNVQEIAKEIRRIENITTDAKGEAVKGSEAVVAANKSMENLDTSSKKIGGIIQVITEISNQTNLLSLNAAIEAIKAGEAGKGFAVVADEVRNLAERSAASVVEIRHLIEQSTTIVAEGNTVNQQTGQILEKIIKLVNEVSFQINSTSQAFTEQEDGIQEIAQTADTFSTTSEKNAEAVNQLSEATDQVAITTEDLAQLSESLIDEVSHFKIE